MRFRLCFRLCLGLVLLIVAQPACAFDFSGWDALLKKYVAPKTIDGVRLSAVNYQKLGQDPIYKMHQGSGKQLLITGHNKRRKARVLD